MRSPVNASPIPSRASAHDLGVDAVRYSFIVMDLHHLLLAGLPAHSALPPILFSNSGSALKTKTSRLKEKIANEGADAASPGSQDLMLATPDQQISLTDPDARSMATSGRGSGVVGYNVQVAVDTAASSDHHA